MDAKILSYYQTERGGHVEISEIRASKLYWKGAEETFKKILELEKGITDDLNKLDDTADKSGDRAASSFIENHLLAKQVCRVKTIADLLSQIKRVGGEGTGLFQLDLELRKNHGIPPWEKHYNYGRDYFESESERERFATVHERFANNLKIRN
ncbi:1492_t:CDS:2 [Diversispora eburnea]|uniref:Ferritin n=1 Tax=Diversispora eburnea TaxID=1213867 RepID=A0A9N8Z3J0_9GLOM|nr:1492_t:CDS:2 [Diversispora eburnea]